ncbi:MAG: hypothetical protein ABJB76_03920 [Candidatus Nitrosocosmicus sp.]
MDSSSSCGNNYEMTTTTCFSVYGLSGINIQENPNGFHQEQSNRNMNYKVKYALDSYILGLDVK